MSELERRDDAPNAALGAMLDEVRAEQPDVDWARVEARLFDEAGEVRAAPAPRPNRGVVVALGLALAAAFALALVSPTRTVDESKSAANPAVTRPALMLDEGRPLAVGDRIFGSSSLRSSGRVSIRLEPGTVATVLDVGERVHLSLESGAITADVVPVPGGEPFAVDVAGKRVAVHGTRLRIALVNGEVEVAVSEGSAVVGSPRNMGRTEGTLVPAGNVGRFGATSSVVADKTLATRLVEDVLSAKPAAVPAAKPAPAEAPAATTTTVAAAPHGKPTPPPVGQPTVPAAAPAVGLSVEQLSAPVSTMIAKIGHCAPSVFENTLTFRVAPSGAVELTNADPGLAPEMAICVRAELAKLAFPTAEAPTTVTRFVKFTGK